MSDFSLYTPYYLTLTDDASGNAVGWIGLDFDLGGVGLTPDEVMLDLLSGISGYPGFTAHAMRVTTVTTEMTPAEETTNATN